MSEHCEFGLNRDEHIRDRIVVGIVDKELSRKLQLMAELTLAQTIPTAVNGLCCSNHKTVTSK